VLIRVDPAATTVARVVARATEAAFFTASDVHRATLALSAHASGIETTGIVIHEGALV